MYASPEIRYEVETEEKKFALVKAAVAHFKAGGNQVIDIDGARVVFSDGWGLVRASNTQPLLVLRFEAKTAERLAEIQGLIEGTLKDLEKGIG